MKTRRHDTEVWTRQRDGRFLGYVPHCSCGWEGTVRRTQSEAEDDATDHVVAASK